MQPGLGNVKKSSKQVIIITFESLSILKIEFNFILLIFSIKKVKNEY